MTKLLSAPNLKKQAADALEVAIVAGSQAWEFAGLPTAERAAAEIALDELLPTGGAIPPIVLSAKELANLTAYRIAPATAQVITIQRANHGEPLAETAITLMCSQLATQTKASAVRLIDEAGQLLEELGNYVERTRKGESIAEMVADTHAKRVLTSETDKPALHRKTHRERH
ncbi:hypothetical protein RO21_11625 [[Actinobacillus] muris]|uniref:Uncharacterized protein n=1 Tax=Muribacter muris TaxID=67855 RepID=A0A0J5P4U3_9PAST|nr:hypothetical protein [Muribacter muris]KMK50469.1 hypothetical protein RO21_11625 [[Actinobacillus] muris] [Muribacter muris]